MKDITCREHGRDGYFDGHHGQGDCSNKDPKKKTTVATGNMDDLLINKDDVIRRMLQGYDANAASRLTDSQGTSSACILSL